MPNANTKETFWSRVDKSGDCWEWTFAKIWNGYGQMKWCGKPILAHRLAWFLTNGKIPDGINVLHKCDNRSCCNPEHLFLGTQKDNVRDMMAKGRSNFTANQKYSQVVINAVKFMNYHYGKKATELSKMFGIPYATMWHLIYNSPGSYAPEVAVKP